MSAISAPLFLIQTHHQKFGDSKDDKGDNKQNQAQLHQCRCVHAGLGFGEFVGQRRGDAVARHVQRSAVELVGVADDKGYRHGLPQRSAQTQHHAADDAVFGERQHDAPDDFPGGAADAVGRLFHHYRRLFEHVAHHRGDVRNDHDSQDNARRQNADAEGRAGEQLADNRDAGHHLADRLLEIGGKQRAKTNSPHIP